MAAKKRVTRKRIAVSAKNTSTRKTGSARGAIAKKVSKKKSSGAKKVASKKISRERVAKKKVVEKGVAKKRATKKKVTKKKVTKRTTATAGSVETAQQGSKKKASRKRQRAGRKALVVPVSTAAERLTARLERSRKMLEKARGRQAAVKEKVIRASRNARIQGTVRAAGVARSAKETLGKVNDRIRTLRAQIRDAQASLVERRKADVEGARRTNALAEAMKKFEDKWQRDYNRKLARRLRAAAAKQRRKG